MNKLFALTILFCFCLSGCSSKNMLRNGMDSPLTEINEESNYKLAFVEIDDQGHFYDRCK